MRRMWSFLAALITVVLGCGTAALPQAQPVLLGVLEDSPGHYADAHHYRDVRAVFRYAGDRWEAFPSSCMDEDCWKSIAAKFPAEVHWTIAFDGRTLGEITAHTPSSFDFYSTVGQQQIIGDIAPSSVGIRSAEFGGFLGEAVYRPLVAVSQPNYRDPDEWKPAQLPKDLLNAARQAFQAKFSKSENCTKAHPDKSAPWPYPLANVAFRKVYASKRRWFLIELSLNGNLCEGSPDDAFRPQWFVVTPQRDAQWLGSDMWLVDAGDYDNDGKSELVFSIDGYNRGGYELFYDDFQHSAVFQFSYH